MQQSHNALLTALQLHSTTLCRDSMQQTQTHVKQCDPEHDRHGKKEDIYVEISMKLHNKQKSLKHLSVSPSLFRLLTTNITPENDVINHGSISTTAEP